MGYGLSCGGLYASEPNGYEPLCGSCHVDVYSVKGRFLFCSL